jgi:hypothetical protein
MIDCDKVLVELWDYLSEKDAHPEYHSIKNHLAACPGCTKESEQILQMQSSLKEISVQPAAGFEERLKARIDILDDSKESKTHSGKDNQQHARLIKVNWKKAIGLVAASAAAVFVIGISQQSLNVSSPDIISGSVITADSELEQGIVSDREWTAKDSLESGPDNVDVNSRDAMHRVSTGH